MKATKEQLYAAIQREREYRKQKWPETGKPLDLHGYMIVAHEELREARLAFCKHVGNEEALRELLQVVAVGIAWYESTGWQDWLALPEAFFLTGDYGTLSLWLAKINGKFIKADLLISNGDVTARRCRKVEMLFGEAIAMGMRALVEHGVVEREEFSKGASDA
jgi:hypothetical protein